MGKYKVGMYVRVSVDYENDLNPRMFAMGQIKEINKDRVLIEFHKNFSSKATEVIHNYIPTEKWYYEDQVTRCKILKGTLVVNYLDIGEIIIFNGKNSDEFYEYYIRMKDETVCKVNEQEIMAEFNRGDVNPCYQLANYEFHSPFWYAKRIVTSEAINMINNFGTGFKSLISARAYLLEHQIDTIIRALNEKECRLMLADEVGLGKTVEALVIINGLKKKKERVLIIVPEVLVNQWKNELEYKLWLKSNIYNGNNLKQGEIVIVPLEDIIQVDMMEIEGEFDYCIIDEVHRSVAEEKVYEKIYTICKIIKKVLLLSATPIQDRKEEYLKLLRLLKPEQYGEMSEVEFQELFEKNSNIKKLVHKAYRNLPLAYGKAVDEDEVEEIFEFLEDIVDELSDDKCIKKLVRELDMDSEDYGEGKVREILAYISMTYQFEKNIIRHRREELKEILPERELETVFYDMKSSSDIFYESNCYDELIEYVEEVKQHCGWTSNTQEYIRILLSAMFSSPWALERVIDIRKKTLGKVISVYNGIGIASSQRGESNRVKRIIESVGMFNQEEMYLENISLDLNRWIKASDYEVNNIEKLMDNPDLIKGRLGKVTDYVEQELFDSKVVIFTSWPETLEKINKILCNLYGDEVVSTFYVKNTVEELEENVFKFQNNNNCRFMLCDELGGEGRNFQIADAIVHLDLPFSPTTLEQRIGRLDRIGRRKDKKVLNIVPVAEDTIEMSLFNLWNNGLNIFGESLSGLEIALEDINKKVLAALKENIKYGLEDALDSIKEELAIMKKNIEEERYYDMAKQLDYNTKKRYESIINHFDNDGGELLSQMMLNWSRAVGFTPSYSEDGIVEFDSRSISNASMEHTMFSIPDTKQSLERSKKSNCIRGTFDRNIAVGKEDLVFFAPGEEIFDSIMRNVEEGYRGRASAIRVVNAPFNWEGFVFKYNTSFAVKELINNNIDIKYSNYAYGHMPVKQYISIVPIDDNDIENIAVKKYVQEELSSYILKTKKTLMHLGNRDGMVSNLKNFKVQYDNITWNRIVHEANRRSIEEVSTNFVNSIDMNKLKRDFSTILASTKAAQQYFNGMEDGEYLKVVLQSVINGIKKAEKTLDSIIYLKMEM